MHEPTTLETSHVIICSPSIPSNPPGDCAVSFNRARRDVASQP